MAFVKTTWIDDADPAITAAQLNRIEAGIGDAWTRLGAAVALTGVGSYEWTGLNGDTDYGYELLVAGTLSSNAVTRTVVLMPQSQVANTDCDYQYVVSEPGVAGPSTGVGDLGGSTGWGVAGTWASVAVDFVAHCTVVARSGQDRVFRCSCANHPRGLRRSQHTNYAGHWRDTATVLTKLMLDFSQATGGTFTGRVLLRPLAPT